MRCAVMNTANVNSNLFALMVKSLRVYVCVCVCVCVCVRASYYASDSKCDMLPMNESILLWLLMFFCMCTSVCTSMYMI
jgi:hypothetical protein